MRAARGRGGPAAVPVGRGPCVCPGWRVGSSRPPANMKFPGSKLLHQWDLSVRHLSLEDLLRSCPEAGLTGLAEAKLPAGAGLLFYYLGAAVNAIYPEGRVGLHRPTAPATLPATPAAHGCTNPSYWP